MKVRRVSTDQVLEIDAKMWHTSKPGEYVILMEDRGEKNAGCIKSLIAKEFNMKCLEFSEKFLNFGSISNSKEFLDEMLNDGLLELEKAQKPSK